MTAIIMYTSLKKIWLWCSQRICEAGTNNPDLTFVWNSQSIGYAMLEKNQFEMSEIQTSCIRRPIFIQVYSKVFKKMSFLQSIEDDVHYS